MMRVQTLKYLEEDNSTMGKEYRSYDVISDIECKDGVMIVTHQHHSPKRAKIDAEEIIIKCGKLEILAGCSKRRRL